jgi:cystathionine gamma-synthase
MDIDTICIHGSDDTTNQTGSITVPIYQTATFSHVDVGVSTGYDYSRLQNPTREHLEKVITELEHGYDTVAFSSGMASITAVMELFSQGDSIIVSDDLYGGTVRFFNTLSISKGIHFIAVNTSNVEDIVSAIDTSTKAIYIESPTNPTMQVTDIKAVTTLAKAHNLLTIVDNTFLTPYFMNPLDLGADIVVHSGTKYLCGHNDTLAGFVTCATKELSEKVRFCMVNTGACLSPFDSWLLIRGIKTLGVRLERQQSNAMQIAKFLQSHRKVTKVLYVGLETHQGHEILKQQARGFGAMISFEVDTKDTAIKLLENIKVARFAESLGGVETLITYPVLQTHADVPKEVRDRKGINDRLLRVSVGIESVNDLINDISQALEV